jgi:uncharacterized protein YodC (DUF2158 family)
MTSVFSVGDVVRLKSGGPKMTVENVVFDTAEDNYSVDCVWFDDANELQEETFVGETLQLVETKA